MTLEEIYYISQIVAVVAILASLIFVGMQVRQSVEQTKLANKLARADMTERALRAFGEAHHEMMSNRQLVEVFRKVMYERSELTPVESSQILFYFNLALHAHRSAFSFVRDGLIDKLVMRDFDVTTAWHLTAPAFASEWKRVQNLGLYRSDFVDHVNALPVSQELPLPPGSAPHKSPVT